MDPYESYESLFPMTVEASLTIWASGSNALATARTSTSDLSATGGSLSAGQAWRIKFPQIVMIPKILGSITMHNPILIINQQDQQGC
jgi:hypothetical protein